MFENVPREEMEDDPDFQPSAGYPAEIRAGPTDEGIRIDSFKIRWDVHSPAPEWVPQPTVGWDRVESVDHPDDIACTELQKVRSARINSYMRCRFCNQVKPPEWMHDEPPAWVVPKVSRRRPLTFH